jgi:hypothetical protein
MLGNKHSRVTRTQNRRVCAKKRKEKAIEVMMSTLSYHILSIARKICKTITVLLTHPIFVDNCAYRPRTVSHPPNDTDIPPCSGTKTSSSLVCHRLVFYSPRTWNDDMNNTPHTALAILTPELGGANEYTDYRDDVIVFSLQTRTWSRPEIRGEVPARYLHSATVYRNKMYVYGGFAKNSKCKSLNLFTLLVIDIIRDCTMCRDCD